MLHMLILPQTFHMFMGKSPALTAWSLQKMQNSKRVYILVSADMGWPGGLRFYDFHYCSICYTIFCVKLAEMRICTRNYLRILHKYSPAQTRNIRSTRLYLQNKSVLGKTVSIILLIYIYIYTIFSTLDCINLVQFLWLHHKLFQTVGCLFFYFFFCHWSCFWNVFSFCLEISATISSSTIAEWSIRKSTLQLK